MKAICHHPEEKTALKPKLKVLVLSSWYPSKVNPTLGNFNEKFSEAIALYHHTSALYVAADEKLTEVHQHEFKCLNNVNTYISYFKKKHTENIFDKLLKSLRFFRYYIKAYKAYQKENGHPDIIHLNILFPVGIVALYLRYRYGIPYVITENWTGYLPATKVQQGFLTKLIGRKIAKKASALLPVTNDLKNALISGGFTNKNFLIVPNVTDVRHFNIPEKKTKNEKKVILHVSSLLDAHKNITGILNVIKKMAEVRHDFELHIVGDGDATPHILRAQESALLNRIVFFHGTMTPAQIAEKMKTADFFLLFSNYENLPCVIVEALASGLPVVSSTAGGIAEHLTPDMGLLMAPGDEDKLFSSCMKMLDSCHAYDKIKLHTYALNNFSYESVGQKFSDIYDTIINNSNN